jgi:hypothetical protein
MKTYHRKIWTVHFLLFLSKERSEDSTEKLHSDLSEKLQWKEMCKEIPCAFSFLCEREVKILDLNDIKLYRVSTKS